MIKNYVKLYRVKNDLTQEQLAAILGVRRETIHFLEKFKHVPSLEFAMKISKFFKEPIENIFYMDE